LRLGFLRPENGTSAFLNFCPNRITLIIRIEPSNIPVKNVSRTLIVTIHKNNGGRDAHPDARTAFVCNPKSERDGGTTQEWQVYQDKVEAAGLQEKKIDFGLARVRQKGVAAESGVSKPQV
jgi:hypothetical protein